MDVVFMQGLPGSGKTQLANYLSGYEGGSRILCSDDIRSALGISHNGDGWSEDKEEQVRFVRRLMFQAFLIRGSNVIIDGTHTTIKSIQDYINLVPEELKDDVKFFICRVDTPLEECKARRVPQGFPEHVIERMAKNLEVFDDQVKHHDWGVVINFGTVKEEWTC